MGLIDILSGPTVTLIGDIPVDVIEDYTPPREAIITERPVQKDFSFTDARIIKPQFLSMMCRFINPDFSFRATARQAIQGKFSTATWREKRDRLYEYFDANELIVITTPEYTYVDMLLTSIRPGKQNTESFHFTVEAREVFIVSTDSVAVDYDSIPKDVKAKETDEQKENNKRKQQEQNKGKAKAEAATEQNKSYMTGGVDAVRSLYGG